ncbi:MULTISPECIES: DMT family transporter [Brevibacterium]|uniref:SMR family transporter n=1 Tax=Brevibacterium salitolerans TaxID=1403566 RepID=A0ABP5I1J9_9MICO|nr:SMR family transporter [Brevibacterium sp.]
MTAWLFLLAAVVCEVGGTLTLRMAASGGRIWFTPVAVGYVAAFSLLSLALSHGMPLGVAYGIWAAAGVALTAVLSRLLFREPLTWLMAGGIVLIGLGVLAVELGSTH